MEPSREPAPDHDAAADRSGPAEGRHAVCGIAALLLRDARLEPELGRLLGPMIGALSDRGPDSSGVAVYARPGQGPPGFESVGSDASLRVSLGSDEVLDWAAVTDDVATALGAAGSALTLPSGVLVATDEAARGTLAAALDRWPSVRILGSGRRLLVAKTTGDPRASGEDLRLEEWSGYQAVAHTRMATESAVTLLHSHPFVPAPDLCVVHNGSFSNYASVRRSLVRRGARFDSDNDSEVAARLLAERLALGDTLEESTRRIMKELDGFFTLVLTTDGEMSVVRDAFACKPAVVAETDRYVAVASEYRALAHLPGIAEAQVFEPGPEEVYTWTR